MKPLATQICIPVLSVLVLFGGCRGWESTEPPVHLNQNMDTQPKLKPYRNSEFFADGRAMRTPPEGTIARGKLKEDDHLYRGKVSGELADTFPDTLPMSAELLERGQERYNIYCTLVMVKQVTQRLVSNGSRSSTNFPQQHCTAKNRALLRCHIQRWLFNAGLRA